jgi:hypothetical protein
MALCATGRSLAGINMTPVRSTFGSFEYHGGTNSCICFKDISTSIDDDDAAVVISRSLGL